MSGNGHKPTGEEMADAIRNALARRSVQTLLGGRPTPPPLFQLGRVVSTATVLERLGCTDGTLPADLIRCLNRHQRGDWGEVDAHDHGENEASLRHGWRLLSVYTVRGVKVWIITEADRSATTLLLPEDY